MTPCADPLVWLVDVAALDEASLAHYAAWLGPSERARCARFVRPERRRQFIVGRALLRTALGRRLGLEPAAIALEERAGQAPGLVFPRGFGGGFSISHSGQWVACAVSAHGRVGLDIERIDPQRDVIALARQAFSMDEVAFLLACAPATRSAAFYRMWCSHEARIKLGEASTCEYFLEAPGLVGMLACAASLTVAPTLVQVRLDAR